MLKKAKDLIDKAESGNRKKPVLFMVVGYGVLWLLLCLILTSVLGKKHMEMKAAEAEKRLSDIFQNTMRDFEEKACQPDFRFADNEDYFTYKMAILEDWLELYSHKQAYGVFQTRLFDQDAIDDIEYRDIAEIKKNYGSVAGAVEQIRNNTLDLRNYDKVILEAYYGDAEEGKSLYWKDCHLTWATCSLDYYQVVFKEIERLRLEGYEVGDASESRLSSYRFAPDFDWGLASWVEWGLDENDANGYSPETEEFYINEEHDFIPKSVVIWYKKPNEERYQALRVNCYEGDCPEGYRYVQTGLSTTILPQYPEGRCNLISEGELIVKGAENYGNRVSYAYFDRMGTALYLDTQNTSCFTVDLLKPTWVSGKKPEMDSYDDFLSWYRQKFDRPFITASNNSFTYLVRFDGSTGDKPNYGISKPFAYFSGDLYVNYYNSFKNAYTGEQIRMYISCILPGALRWTAQVFLLKMIWLYLGILLFFAFLGWWNYRRIYSIRGKNQFYRSLVNSMAHDLKSPLMVMQGYCENLKENVHSEKKEYYADQVLTNIQYLNGLIEKNLYYSKQRENAENEGSNEPIFLSELVKASVERNRKLLMEKNTPVLFSGETILAGDVETWSLVVDNLIANAAKYSYEDGKIEITGTGYGFSVINRAELSYGKNLQNLLDPLEMGDESRTAGKGTGLGLSIANGIVRGYGGRIKLSYDKMSKEFICQVRLKRIWKRVTQENEE